MRLFWSLLFLTAVLVALFKPKDYPATVTVGDMFLAASIVILFLLSTER